MGGGDEQMRELGEEGRGTIWAWRVFRWFQQNGGREGKGENEN